MALFNFIRKQFLDVIEWVEQDPAVLAWAVPMQDREIQNGATLVVRPGQQALFVNEGVVADLFGPGSHTLTTRTLPVLTNLKNWDKLFDSPFKSDVVYFSTRVQVDRKWGTPQPVTVRDAEFGAVRLRAFGNCSWRVQDPTRFQGEIVGTRPLVRADDLDGQLRGLILQAFSQVFAGSGVAFLDLAANQQRLADLVRTALAPEWTRLGLALDGLTVQNLSLPDELQKILDQKIGMGMVGQDMNRLMQYQTAQAIPTLAAGVGQGGGGGAAAEALGIGTGLAMGQVLAQNMAAGLGGAAPGTAPAAQASGAPSAGASPPMDAGAVMALLEKLGELKSKGILTDEEFAAKKADLLQRL